MELRSSLGLKDPAMEKRDLKMITEALLSQSASGGGWQDIATAPKDGTKILLLIDWDDFSYVGRFMGDVWEVQWNGDVPAADDPDWVPTHWQPLPPPPTPEDT